MNRPYVIVFNMKLDNFARGIFAQHNMEFPEAWETINVCVECAQEFI